jgi:hypothetical protein
MALQPLVIKTDKNATNFFALSVPQYVCARVVAAASEQVTVPSGANFVVFSATADFYAAYGANPTAVVGADDDTGVSSELNPSVRYIGPQDGLPTGVAKIAVFGTATVTLAFYK